MTAPEKYYAFDLCSAYTLPGGRLLIRNPRNGRHAVLTPDVYGALLQCRRFQTLSQHAANVVAGNPALEGQESAVLEILQSVQRDGLMLSADIYCITLQPASKPLFNVDKPVAAIITWERPEALERCLESLRSGCDTNNLARIVVIDDSRSESVRARNRANTEAFAAQLETSVLYLGAEEQQGFMEAIIRQVPSIEAQVRFLIDRKRWAGHWTSGLARTLALLLSVGRRLLVLDDDILCEVYEPRQSAVPGISFGDDARETRFYHEQDDWQESPAKQGRDPLLRHMRTLGSALSDALGALGVSELRPENFAGAELEMLERLRGDSRVLVTECGTLGDPGTSNLNWLVTLEGDSLEEMLATDDTVGQALSSRQCWHGMRQARMLPRSNMSQLTGLDNRAMLPPYVPILRGEDRLFGDMIEFMHPDAVVLDQPWAIAHLPIPERRWSEEQQHFQTAQPFERLGQRWIERQQGTSSAREPLKRLAHMARLYEGLADLDDQQLRRRYEDFAIGERAANYGLISDALQRCGEHAPQRWRKFLEEGAERLNRELVENPPDAVLAGYPGDLDDAALMAWWRAFWIDFARALRAWPAIRQAARQVQI